MTSFSSDCILTFQTEWEARTLKISAAIALWLALGLFHGANAQTDVRQANRYLCYVVEGVKAGGHEGGKRRARDQFGEHKLTIAKPRMICNPVDLSGKVVPKSEVHMECYSVTAQETTQREVVVNSDFEAKQHIVLADPQLVCVPAKKRIVK